MRAYACTRPAWHNRHETCSPGLNAVVRAVVKNALAEGKEVVGILDGFHGLLTNRTVKLVGVRSSCVCCGHTCFL